MAACGSLQHIFENPLPENHPTLLESLSPWNQIKPVNKPSNLESLSPWNQIQPVNKPSNIDQSSFTEIFGELHFKENSLFLSSSSSCSSASSSSSLLDLDPKSKSENPPLEYSFSSSKYSTTRKHSDSFSVRNSESLQLCTEGLGFESSDYEVEDLSKEVQQWQKLEEKPSFDRRSSFGSGENIKRSRTATAAGGKGGFPPPISCLSKSGKPWVCFKSYREDGRFVLKEIRVRSQEFLHACREDGRLKLHFVQPNDEISEDEQDSDDDDDDDEDEEGEDNEEDGADSEELLQKRSGTRTTE